MRNSLFVLLSLLLTLSFSASSQSSSSNELRFEVNRIYQPFSITKEKMTAAQSVFDLNRYIKESWVREYISIEILTSHNGVIKKSVIKNDTLNQGLIDIMKMADVGTDISVNIQYIPENNLKQNDEKEIKFTFTIEPENEAEFPGGQLQLKKYLKDNAIAKIPTGRLAESDLSAIKFTINELGQIIDADVFQSVYKTSENNDVDELLLEAICNMPNWKPAEYADGMKVKQEFALTVGNLESCLINLVNVPKD